MSKIQVFDPAMCCPTGVCGPEVDPALVRFAADLEWLKTQGVEVERFNLAQQPAAFVSNAEVAAAMRARDDALPLLLVDGKVVAQGSYPAREVLAELAGISPFAWIVNQSLTQVTTRDPVLRARRAAERPYLEEVAAIARRLAVVAWEPATPRGAEHLSVPER